MESQQAALQCIVDDIYGNLIREKGYKQLANSAILSTRNRDVEEINKRVVESFDKTTERYIQVLIVLKVVIMETLMKAFYLSTSIH